MDKNDKNATSLNDLFALYETEMKIEQKPKQQQQVIEHDEEVDVVAAVKEEVTPTSIIESTLSILAASSKKKDNPKKNNSLMEQIPLIAMSDLRLNGSGVILLNKYLKRSSLILVTS